MQYENKRNIKRKGLTLSQLADTMDVSRQALSRQVAGKLLVEKAEEIATALNVPIWQLFVSPNEVAGGVLQYYFKGGTETICKRFVNFE